MWAFITPPPCNSFIAQSFELFGSPLFQLLYCPSVSPYRPTPAFLCPHLQSNPHWSMVSRIHYIYQPVHISHADSQISESLSVVTLSLWPRHARIYKVVLTRKSRTAPKEPCSLDVKPSIHEHIIINTDYKWAHQPANRSSTNRLPSMTAHTDPLCWILERNDQTSKVFLFQIQDSGD